MFPKSRLCQTRHDPSDIAQSPNRSLDSGHAFTGTVEDRAQQAAQLITDDATYVWHPFTHPHTAGNPLPVVRANGAYVWDAEGNRYIDAISSWWVTVHGHGHPTLVTALRQAAQLDHVHFAGNTHPQAVALAKQLNTLYPSPEDPGPEGEANHWRTFFSDNGSTAVEVALKMAYQYWQQVGQPQRTRFLAMDGGYHGDTVGAMSVGFGSGFYQPFESLCFPVQRLPYPEHYWGNETIEYDEAESLAALERYLDEHGSQTAAFIAEPMLQGASGMRLSRPQYWNAVIERLKAHNVLVIFDEVLTGFGRTGTMFAAEHLTHSPDLVCLSKGLTGGMLPLGATLVGNNLYQAFHGAPNATSQAFLHGHSFTASPIACAVANANLYVFTEEATLERIAGIHQAHTEHLAQLVKHHTVYKPRTIGPIAAVNLAQPQATYDHPLRHTLTEQAKAAGILLRPWGNTWYTLPPACITPIDLGWLYKTLKQSM